MKDRQLHGGSAETAARSYEVALELTDGGEHVEQQAPGQARRVDGLVEHDDVHLFGFDLLRDLCEIEGRRERDTR